MPTPGSDELAEGALHKANVYIPAVWAGVFFVWSAATGQHWGVIATAVAFQVTALSRVEYLTVIIETEEKLEELADAN